MTVIRVSTNATNGDAPPNFTGSFGTGGVGITDVQSNRFRTQTASAVGTAASAGILSSIHLPYDHEILCRITPGQAWSGSTTGFVIVLADSWTTGPGRDITNGWHYQLYGDGNFAAVSAYVAGVQQTQVSATYTPSGSTAVWARCQHTAGLARLKLWNDGTREPNAWTIPLFSAATSPNILPAVGPWKLGFGVYGLTAAVAVRRFDFDQITVGNLGPIKSLPNFRRF